MNQTVKENINEIVTFSKTCVAAAANNYGGGALAMTEETPVTELTNTPLKAHDDLDTSRCKSR